MRNGLIGPTALMLVLAVPTAACSSGGASAGSAGSGGASASGGASGGSGGASGGGGGASGGGGGASGGGGGASGGGGGASGGGGGASGGGSGGNGGAGGGSQCSAGGATGKLTTLDGTKDLKDLSPTEATQLCNETNTYFGCVIGSADRCKWAGLRAAASTSPQSDAQMQSNCSHYEDSCRTGGPTGAGADCLSSIASSSACTATVAQYSACVADETAAFNTTVKGFPACAATKVSDISPINEAEGATPPASCAALNDACPSLDQPSPLTL